jgi:hypothetical protein
MGSIAFITILAVNIVAQPTPRARDILQRIVFLRSTEKLPKAHSPLKTTLPTDSPALIPAKPHATGVPYPFLFTSQGAKMRPTRTNVLASEAFSSSSTAIR